MRVAFACFTRVKKGIYVLSAYFENAQTLCRKFILAIFRHAKNQAFISPLSLPLFSVSISRGSKQLRKIILLSFHSVSYTYRLCVRLERKGAAKRLPRNKFYAYMCKMALQSRKQALPRIRNNFAKQRYKIPKWIFHFLGIEGLRGGGDESEVRKLFWIERRRARGREKCKLKSVANTGLHEAHYTPTQ